MLRAPYQVTYNNYFPSVNYLKKVVHDVFKVGVYLKQKWVYEESSWKISSLGCADQILTDFKSSI